MRASFAIIATLLVALGSASFRPQRVVPVANFNLESLSGHYNVIAIWNDTAADALEGIYEPKIQITEDEDGTMSLDLATKSYKNFEVTHTYYHFQKNEQTPAVLAAISGDAKEDMIVIEAQEDSKTFVLLRRDSKIGFIVSTQSRQPEGAIEKLFFQIPHFAARVHTANFNFNVFTFPAVHVRTQPGLTIKSYEGKWFFSGVYAPKHTKDMWAHVGCHATTYDWVKNRYQPENPVSTVDEGIYPDPENLAIHRLRNGGTRVVNYLSDTVAVVMYPESAQFAALFSRNAVVSDEDWDLFEKRIIETNGGLNEKWEVFDFDVSACTNETQESGSKIGKSVHDFIKHIKDYLKN